MSIIEVFRVALGNLVSNKLRSVLTMLGIIIGVGAVIALLALGGAVQAVVSSELEGLGTNLIFLFAGTNNATTNQAVPPRLTNEDVAAINSPLNAPAVRAAAAEYSRKSVLVYQGTRYDTVTAGVTTNYPLVRNASVASGRFFDQQEVDARSRVVVVGKKVSDSLFHGINPVGQRMRINDLSFHVVGVMAERGGTFASNEDDFVFIPISTAQDRLFPAAAGTVRKVEVTVVYLQAINKDAITQAIDQTTKLLRRRQNLTFQDNNFSLVTQEDLVSSFGIITSSITVFLGAIAAISLLVGGIGIMNIMLVSVTERTREIGLRKAVGARRRDVLTQFLVEAMMLSLLGGLLGIALGYLMAAIGAVVLQRYASNAQAAVQPESILLATLTSIAVGVFFGLYPAMRASRLNPIEALRHE